MSSRDARGATLEVLPESSVRRDGRTATAAEGCGIVVATDVSLEALSLNCRKGVA